MIRYFLVVLFLVAFQPIHSDTSIPSYQELLQQFIEKSKASPSKFSTDDKAVMKKASESLAKALPNPGIKVGEKAPNFVLINAVGKEVSLKDELKKGSVILVFYRGAWCPFCNMHLHVLQKNLPEFEKYGAQLIAITPQSPEKSAEQIKKDSYPFEVLSDLDSQVMKDYRLYFDLPEDLIAVYKRSGLDIEDFNGKGRTVLPVPGTFVIDTNGVIQAMHAQTDYKSRMEPASILSVLKKISKEG